MLQQESCHVKPQAQQELILQRAFMMRVTPLQETLRQQRVTKRLILTVTWVQLRAAAWCSCSLLGRSKGVASNA